MRRCGAHAAKPEGEEIEEAMRLAARAPAQFRGWSFLTAYEKACRALLALKAENARLAAEVERLQAERATDQQRQTIAYYLGPEAPGGWAEVAVAAKKLRDGHDEAVRRLSALTTERDALRQVETNLSELCERFIQDKESLTTEIEKLREELNCRHDANCYRGTTTDYCGACAALSKK
jgi:DNA repair exonuclease SbcCD ATPase subunit